MVLKTTAVGTAAFALSLASVASTEPRAPEPSTAVSQPSNQTSPETQAAKPSGTMTLVGCLVKESDYRRDHGLKQAGLAGIRTGSDFVLVDATNVAEAGAPGASAATGTCSERGSGPAYRLAGHREGELKPFVGRYVEITGRFEHAHDARTAAGQTSAKLPPEIVVASYRQAQAPAVERSTEQPSSPPVTPSPAPAQPQPAPPAQAGTTGALPGTASNEPLIALIGFLSLGAGVALRWLRRQES